MKECLSVTKVYDEVNYPSHISSKIDPANILPGRTRQSACLAFAMQSSATNISDPKTYAQALARPDSAEWMASVDCELQALEDMNVWYEVQLPEGEHALGTTWVFKRKTGPSGELIKYKARLFAQGFSQIEGVD